MFLCKNTYKDADGKKCEAAKWTIGFADATGQRRRLPAFTDKKASESLGRTLERLVACKASGEPLSVEVQRWLEGLAPAMRERLAAWGLLSGHAKAAGKTLKAHVEDWRVYLLARGRTTKHVAMACSHVLKVIEGRFTYCADVKASSVVEYLGELKRLGTSARTANAFLQSIKSFCRWLCADGRATLNPLAYLSATETRTDRRRVRRALTVDEVRALLTTTEQEPDRHGLAGTDRALLYRLAIESGLRASELASLTRESFHLAGASPTATVLAGYSKHRREDVLQLRHDTAVRLRLLVGQLLPGAHVFRLHKHPRYALMLQADLAAARLTWLAEAKTPKERQRREESDFLRDADSSGRVIDFHSLRHTTGTLLCAAGVHPRVAQSLLRHSTVDLTMSLYTHPYAEQETDAIAKLPDFSTKPKAKRAETGGT